MTANPLVSDQFFAGIGSREIDERGKSRIRIAGRALRELGWTCRSGHAKGSDQTWEEVAGEDAEVYKPWASFEWDVPILARTVYDEPTDLAYEIAAKYHPGWPWLRDHPRALHARNTHQVLGRDCETPSHMVCCWTRGGKMAGGTAQALRIAIAKKIMIFNFGDEDQVADFEDRFGFSLGARPSADNRLF